MLTKKQYKLLKKMSKEKKTDKLLTDDEKVKINYLVQSGFCVPVIPRTVCKKFSLYKCTENGFVAIAEYRRNNLKSIPPWLSVLLSVIAIGISIYALIQSIPAA